MLTDTPDDVLAAEPMAVQAGPPANRQQNWPASPSDASSPIIGIPLPVQQSQQGLLLLADAGAAWAIERMGGRLLLIPFWPLPLHQQVYQSLWKLLPLMDGLVLPPELRATDEDGPENVNQQAAEVGLRSRSWERALIHLVTFLGMPLLAIAEGALRWNRALGGTSRPPSSALEQAPPIAKAAWEPHTIRVRASSHLAGLLQAALNRSDGEPPLWELAFVPGQQVERLASGLRVCAQSETGMIAAFERADAFGLGILGRLDWGLDQPYGRCVLHAFLQACRSFDQQRQRHPAWEAARESICARLQAGGVQGQALLAGTPAWSRARDLPSPPRAVPLPSSPGPGRPERFRQRSHPPTKEELNRIRRQRLKTLVAGRPERIS